MWIDNQFPYKLYGAQQDDNTRHHLEQRRSVQPGRLAARPRLRDRADHAVSRQPDIVYGSCKGQYGVMDLKTGQEKNYWVGAQSLYGNPASDLIYRFQRVSPMATSPHDPSVALLRIAVPASHARQGRDVGEDLAGSHRASRPCCQGVSGEPITRDVTGEEFYSTLYAIAESPLEKGVIWTGSNDGPFYVTRDDGKTWTNVTPKDLPPGGRVQYIDASPHPQGLGVLRGVSLSARRLPAVHLQDRRLRQDVDAADRRQERHSRRLADARRARRSRIARACSTRAPSSGCSSRSTTARTGSRSS